MSLDYVVYSITTRCNLACPGCFRVGSRDIDAFMNSFSESLSILKHLGCRYLNISGGEPLLNENVWDMIKLTSSKGIKPILSTNGILLRSIGDPRMVSVYGLSLPLDAATPELNDMIRCPGHFKHTLNLINEYVQTNRAFFLKINTIVVQENISNLTDILSLINHDRIIWKLFQYAPRGTFTSKNRLTQITDNQFKWVTRQIAETPGMQCRVLTLSANEAADYIIIDPNGDIYLPNGHDYCILGNICDPKVIDVLGQEYSNSFYDFYSR